MEVGRPAASGAGGVAVIELPAAAVELIEGGSHAHLATIGPTGAPQVTMVWSTVEDGEICVASLTPRAKLANIRRDPRVVLSYESAMRDDGQGLHFYLTVSGRARVTEGGAPELLRRIAPRYVGAGTRFPRGDSPPPGWVIRVEPERVRGYGPWAGNA